MRSRGSSFGDSRPTGRSRQPGAVPVPSSLNAVARRSSNIDRRSSQDLLRFTGKLDYYIEDSLLREDSEDSGASMSTCMVCSTVTVTLRLGDSDAAPE